ncbi:uncharacterized protein [Paramisgurnus dabryanus]|uniref:uncharacterized protein n=1 Tax=Paramisgurnus dabryanus TaxID=90735 RepID=UPI0031F3B7D6
MAGIIPRSKTKGVDICAGKEHCYIIRSDLGCYMQTSDLNKGSNISIFSLHPSCQNGEHYFADMDGYFYIIKGESYRRVKDLSTDADAVVKDLHPELQGGDHYMSINNKFFIIFQESLTIKKTYHLNRFRYMWHKILSKSFTIIFPESNPKLKPKLNPKSRDGLYFWGLSDDCCFLKPVSEWGVEYGRIINLEENGHLQMFSVHPDVVNFLPGGLSITRGPAFGRWEIIKTIRNYSDATGKWGQKITTKVGYNEETIKQITNNWKIETSLSSEPTSLAALITKCQLSFSAEYGGSRVDTTQKSWNKAIEVEEELTLELKPRQCIYLWQYILGLGDEPVLFCRDLIIGDQPTPPTDVPLPPAKPQENLKSEISAHIAKTDK